MKLTKRFQWFKTHNLYFTWLLTFCGLTLFSLFIWFKAPALANKKIEIIAALYLLWLLKLVIFDMDTPHPFQYQGVQTRKKLQDLQKRFKGALQFLKKPRLNQLPWFLMIGTPHAGKTSLLAHANINFILQRQFQTQDLKNLEASENCDWWVSKDNTFIDVPGKYIVAPENVKNRRALFYPLLWRFFLRLIKKYRGKAGIQGIILTLPLPEMMKLSDPKIYHTELRQLLNRLDDLHKIFPQPLPCFMVITKCDLISGFKEFFGESTQEEITQAWGISLPPLRPHEKIQDVFTEQFDLLIKKLNQQLLWRLHQERNPMARPYIKDFPLQIEFLKEALIDFLKKLSLIHTNLQCQGVHLTSALQKEVETENQTIEEIANTKERAIALFKEPQASSRAYFIKQFFTYHLAQAADPQSRREALSPWSRRIAFFIAACFIGSATYVFGKDFQEGMKQSYAIQKTLSNYQLSIQQDQDPDDRLMRALTLVNALQSFTRESNYKLDIAHLLTFYSHKASEKSKVVFYNVLQSVFIPEVTHYLADYLEKPVNKNADTLYSALKIYLMLGDANHFQPEVIENTFVQILPKTFTEEDTAYLKTYLNMALTTHWTPQTLNMNLVTQTRKYLNSIPEDQLGYVILKNINSNTSQTEVNLGTENNRTPILINNKVVNEIATMFTAASFPRVINQETSTAAEETLNGNWILGTNVKATSLPSLNTALTQQLQTLYLNNYISTWESLLSHIRLADPQDLAQVDTMIIHLTSNDSPLLQLLQTLHDNTYFEPVSSTSQTLQKLSVLIDKNNISSATLTQIFNGLNAVHQQVQQIITSPNAKRASFEYVTNDLRKNNPADPLIQLRTIAQSSPEPIKTWLEKIANDTWHLILQDATRYIDISWQTEVVKPYQKNIANHYPFALSANEEVDVGQFTAFFGSTGKLLSYYNNVLKPFIDTSAVNWQWRPLNNEKPPFKEEVLYQLQQALHINKTFFPNGDNKLYVQYSLQPYKIKPSKLVMNNRYLVDRKNGTKNFHLILLNLNQLQLPNKIIKD